MYHKVLALAFVAAVGTGVAFFKPLTSKLPNLTNTATTAESVQIKSATVDGNVATDRLSSEKSPVVKTKTLLNVKVNKARVVYLNSEVTYDSAQSVANQIKELNNQSDEPIFLLIDSPGGSVLDGATVISEIEASRAPVNTVCTRLCASMAAMIHSYGAKRYSTDRSFLMYHPASAGVRGQVPNMLSELGAINRYMDKMVANVVTRSKLSKKEYGDLISYELWIDSEDSLDKGLIDGIVHLDVPSAEARTQALPPQQEPDEKKSTYFNVQLVSPHPELWNRNARQD